MADRKPTVLNPAGYQENLQDTDNLVVEAAPTADNHVVNKKFIDDLKVEIDGDIADAGKWEESAGKLYPKDLTNKVGIGTSNPTVPLQVNSEGGTQIRLQDTRNDNRYGDIQTTGSLYLTARLDDQRGAIVFRGRNDVDTVEYGRWSGSGRFGIGTDSPSNALHVISQGAPLNTSAKFESTTNNSYINFVDPNGTTFIGNNGNDTKFLQGSGATERMRITSDGNVGIGTDSPERLLHVSNSGAQNDCEIRIENTDGEGRQLTFLGAGSVARGIRHTGKSAGDALAFTAGSATHMLIDSNGNVGIGTDSPGNKLTIDGGTGTATSRGVLSVRQKGDGQDDGISLTSSYSNAALVYMDENGKFTLGTSRSTQFKTVFDTDTGNFGIGTDSPEARLDVAGDAQVGGNPSAGANTGTRIYSGGLCQVSAPNTTSPVWRAYQTGSSTVTSLIQADGSATFAGNVGIGQDTPGASLEIATTGQPGVPSLFLNRSSDQTNTSDIALRANSVIRSENSIKSVVNDGGIFTWNVGGSDVKAGLTGASEVMRIDTNGNLDVSGSITANNFDIGGITKDSYLRKDVNDSASGDLTFNGRTNIRGGLDISDGQNVDFGSSDDIKFYYQGSDNYLYCDFKTAGAGIIFKDNGNNQIVLEDSGVFRPTANNTTGKIGTSGSYWHEGYFNEFRVSDHLGIGIGTAAPSAPLDLVGTNESNGVLRIRSTVNNPNLDYYFAQEVTATLSGSTATTADREQGGIWVDVNDSATGGDTNHEHRVYGVFADVDCTGDPDLVYGVYGDATVTPSEGTVGAIYGVYGRAEDNGGAGNTSTVVGVRGEATADNANSDVNNLYGGWFRSTVSNDAGPSTVITGCLGEVEISTNTSASNVAPEAHCVRAEYDNNGTVAQSSSAYLFYGNYSGILPTNAYGVYITDDVPSIFKGSIQAKSFDIDALPALP